MAPYYNKPSAEAQYQHFKAVHDATDIPIILYNVPGRTVINMTDETISRLAQLPRIVGIKDATGDLARPLSLRALTGSEFIQLSGEDLTAVAFNANGGVGCISVTSNIAPKACANVQELTQRGDYAAALHEQEKLTALHQVMFCESSPGPAKYAASLLGYGNGELRMPLLPPSEISQKRIREVLVNLGLL